MNITATLDSSIHSFYERCMSLSSNSRIAASVAALIYPGGYVRIKDICWLDRNLTTLGCLTLVAIPSGVAGSNCSILGKLFSFWLAHRYMDL